MAAKIINIETFAGGAVGERLNIELQNVLENINDLNTDPKKAREVTLKIKITPAENRQTASIDVSAKTSLAPAKAIPATIILDKDEFGKATAKELKSTVPGQMYIDEDGDAATDVGEKIGTLKPANVVNFK